MPSAKDNENFPASSTNGDNGPPLSLINELKALLQCSICRERFVLRILLIFDISFTLSSKIIAIFTHLRFLNPRMLPCQHSFCSDCINRMQQCNDCLCPVCRTRFKHADIRDCLFLNNVLEVAARHPCLDEPRTATPPQAVTRDSCEYLVSGYEHVRFFIIESFDALFLVKNFYALLFVLEIIPWKLGHVVTINKYDVQNWSLKPSLWQVAPVWGTILAIHAWWLFQIVFLFNLLLVGCWISVWIGFLLWRWWWIGWQFRRVIRIYTWYGPFPHGMGGQHFKGLRWR